MDDNGDILLVCSGGGHLRQLASFVERMGYPVERQVWVTFQNALSESILAGREVIYAPFTAPRDLKNFARLVVLAQRILSKRRFSEVISTGSSPAVAFLVSAAARGMTAQYIESAARADGPSLTGRMISKFPSINTYCQYPAWADKKWEFRGSVFDEFTSGPQNIDSKPRSAVVSVGTQEGYAFPRMLEAVIPLLAGFDKVLYQTGDLDMRPYGVEGRASVPYAELQQAVKEADVVISHSGVGGALTALHAGKHPIMIPRSMDHHEHVDDHQIQVGRELERRGLATMRLPDRLTLGDIVSASQHSTIPVLAAPFSLRAPR